MKFYACVLLLEQMWVIVAAWTVEGPTHQTLMSLPRSAFCAAISPGDVTKPRKTNGNFIKQIRSNANANLIIH